MNGAQGPACLTKGTPRPPPLFTPTQAALGQPLSSVLAQPEVGGHIVLALGVGRAAPVQEAPGAASLEPCLSKTWR